MSTRGSHALALSSAVALLAGCGGGSQAACAAAAAGTGARVAAHVGEETAFLSRVAVEADRCADRITFEFRGGAPGFRVRYLPASEALVEDGSGNPVQVEGAEYLVVRLDPALTAEAEGDRLVRTYDGPRRLRPLEARSVREVVKTGDFEAVVTWVVGLPEKRPFRVTTSDEPSRVVVEIG